MRRRRVLNFLVASAFAATIFSSLIPGTYVKAATSQPKIVGKTAITVDLKTGEIIYAQGIDEKMFPASTTKLMTALLFAENKNKTDIIPYTESAKAQPAYALSTDILRNKIKVGDTMSADDVMKALLLFSANDSAYMIADAVGGNSSNFIKMMNDRVAKLGLKNTNFVTPNGLHDENHYTSAYDLSVISRESYKNDWVRDVIGTKSGKIQTSTGAIAYIENRNKLLGQNGAIGGKTGYTAPAGRCLVALYERDGRSIVGIVMKSEYDAADSQVFKDMESIIDWSYNAKPVTIYEKGKELKTETVSYKAFKYFGPEKSIEVPIIINEDATYYDNAVNKAELKTEISLSNLDPWKLSKDTKIGQVNIKQREASKSYDLYTTVTSKDLFNANKGLYAITGIGAVVALVVIILAILFIGKGIRRGRNRSTFRYR